MYYCTDSNDKQAYYEAMSLTDTQPVDEMHHEKLIERTSKSVLRRRFAQTKRHQNGELTVFSSNGKLTEQQKKGFNSFTSFSNSPPRSLSFIRWLGEQSDRFFSRFEADRWLIVLVMGVLIGLIAALLKQSITGLGNLQWSYTNSYLKAHWIAVGFWFCFGVNSLYVLFSGILTTYVNPPSAGGGTVDVIAFLNGIVVHDVLTVKNFIVKFVATTFANASILPTSTQAPIITLGAIVGAVIGQFEIKAIGFRPRMFAKFRNAQTRRELATAGLASGVAAGFNSPVGGLLFAMEDMASFWNKSLTWLVFACCVVSVIVANLFNAAFSGFRQTTMFGFLNNFNFKQIQLHFSTLLTAVVIGFIGGILGALFVRSNVVINDIRKKLLTRVENINVRRVFIILEMLLIVMLMTSFSVFLPFAFGCVTINNSTASFNDTVQPCGDSLCYKSIGLSSVNCLLIDSSANDSAIQYNPMSTLVQGTGTAYLTKLWSRETYYLFEWHVCLAAFACYFALTLWTLATSLAIGILLPMLVSGSLYGRAIGVAMVHVWQSATGTASPNGTNWQWIDPGVMAAIGAASLFGGCNRVAVASIILVAEMVGDMSLVVPNLVAVFVAKTVADHLTRPLYKYQLDAKSIPYLDPEPRVVVAGKLLNLELCRAADVMVRSVATISIHETVGRLAHLLVTTNQSAFPVVGVEADNGSNNKVLRGLLTRVELYVILCNDEVYEQLPPGTAITPMLTYEELSVDHVDDVDIAEARILEYTQSPCRSLISLDLTTFSNTSVPKVDLDYSLYQTYMMFRTLGLHHLVVVDHHNMVVGMISRADLLSFRMSERIDKLLLESNSDFCEKEVSRDDERNSPPVAADESTETNHDCSVEMMTKV